MGNDDFLDDDFGLEDEAGLGEDFDESDGTDDQDDGGQLAPIDSNTDEGDGDDGGNVEEGDDDFETSLLKSIGISDKSKIQFENEAGEMEEVDWNDLSDREKFELIQASRQEPETGLDDDEIELINAIRSSELSPTEYLRQFQKTTIDSYTRNTQQPAYNLKIDQYSDDDLWVADFVSRMGDVSEQEASDALEGAKANEELFKKQIQSLREQYGRMELEEIRQAQYDQQLAAQQQYDRFRESIVNEINNFTDIQGVDLGLQPNDMQNLYDFITGVDGSGNNYFAKALSDPATLVKAAWLTLNGDQMIEELNDYWVKQINKTKRDSYKQGQEDARNGIDNSKTFIRKGKRSKLNAYDDLDEF